MGTGVARAKWALARAKSHHDLRVRWHGRKSGRWGSTHVSRRGHHAWRRTAREALSLVDGGWVTRHGHHSRREVRIHATVGCGNSRRRTHRSITLLRRRRRRRLTVPSRRWHMFKTWRSLENRGLLRRALGVSRTPRGHGAVLGALGIVPIIKVSHRRPVGHSAPHLITVRPLHVGNGRIIQESGCFLGSQPRRGAGHHFWHQTRRRGRTGIRGLRQMSSGWGADSNLLHQAEQVLPVTRLVIFTSKLRHGTLLWRAGELMPRKRRR